MNNLMNKSVQSASLTTTSVAILLLLIVARLLLLSSPDLIDTTEGRYASVGKMMFESGDWVAPHINRTGTIEPYWGKPPLHFWMMSAAYKAFGLNNFAARLPSLVSAIGICLVLFFWGRTLFSSTIAYNALLILVSTVAFFFLSGSCVLDVTLTFCITMAYAGFILSDRSRIWGYLCFIGLALGMLTKGPVALVLFGGAALPWSIVWWLFHRELPAQLKQLPWLGGLMAFFLIATPWYILHERAQPGSLYYFLINENLLRYLASEYGDKYGLGHVEPRGMVWFMLFWSCFPWSLFVVLKPIVGYKSLSFPKLDRFKEWLKNEPLLLFVALAGLACPAFFTFAKQLTPTYVLPALPALSLALAVVLERQEQSLLRKISEVSLKFFCALVTIGSIVACAAFEAPLLPCTLSAVIGISLLGLKKFFKEPVQIVSLSTLCTFCAVVLCYSQFISSKRSTGMLFSAVREYSNKTGQQVSVGFPFQYPFSSGFYNVQSNGLPINVLKLDLTKTPELKTDLLAVPSRDREKLKELGLEYTEVWSKGRWLLIRPTGK